MPDASDTFNVGFNLVIEMLFFSSHVRDRLPGGYLQFQSRNRDAFLFKPSAFVIDAGTSSMFQSRNRDAFLFKAIIMHKPKRGFLWFQSRNRDAFLFKFSGSGETGSTALSFNLVIEMLFFSRRRRDRDTDADTSGFQSRNRDAFLFKLKSLSRMPPLFSFQSRNRDAFLFKSRPIDEGEKPQFTVSIS